VISTKTPMRLRQSHHATQQGTIWPPQSRHVTTAEAPMYLHQSATVAPPPPPPRACARRGKKAAGELALAKIIITRPLMTILHWVWADVRRRVWSGAGMSQQGKRQSRWTGDGDRSGFVLLKSLSIDNEMPGALGILIEGC